MLAEQTKPIKCETSFSRQRLETALQLWEGNKQQKQYQHLYVCARSNGKKIKSVWINKQDNARSTLENSLVSAFKNATSFDVEFLFDPQKRELDLNNKNQWNSLRGKYAAIIDCYGQMTKWSSLEMIARNLSFNRVAYHHLGQCKNTPKNSHLIPFTVYKTEQFYCGNESRDISHQQPLKLYRGNQVVAINEINKNSLLITIKAMTSWLAAQVNEQGQANYKYWPSRGEYATSNNPIRQWMATVCLNRAAKAFNNEGLKQIAEKNLNYNLQTTFKQDEEHAYIWMNGSAKLGSAALAALAIFESPNRQQHLEQEYALSKLLNELSNTDGSFDTFYIPRERKDNQNFYSGEALLFLASRFIVSRNEKDLARFMAGFNYYQAWHFKNRNPAFVPWHTQACFLVWEVTKDQELKSFIFEMNDWLLAMQQWKSTEFSDMQGRFYDPQRSYYGPPHASSTGVYLEGLIDAFTIAKQCDDNHRAENYRVAILRGIRSIMQLQYKNETDCFYVQNAAQVLGGMRTAVYDNTIRIDNVQHALMAFFKINARFSETDFTVDSRPAAKHSQLKQMVFKHHKAVDAELESNVTTKNLLYFKLKNFKADLNGMLKHYDDVVAKMPAIPYHHAGIPYEGWAITSRDGSIDDGIKRVGKKNIELGCVKINDSVFPTELCGDVLKKLLKSLDQLGLEYFRVRYMRMESTNFEMKFHRDANKEAWRLHIPILTNPHSYFEWKLSDGRVVKKHLPADGSAYLVRVDELHRGTNFNPQPSKRIHFLLSLRNIPDTVLIDEPFIIPRINERSLRSNIPVQTKKA